MLDLCSAGDRLGWNQSIDQLELSISACQKLLTDSTIVMHVLFLSLSHFAPAANICRQQEPLHRPPMGLPRDPCPKLPACPSAGIDGKAAGRLPLGEAKLTALGHETAGECPLIDRLRVIAEEPDEGRDELDYRLRLPCFPIENRPGVHPKVCGCLFLGDEENETPTADMVAQGLWLEVV
jgi:hypothetical protein